MYTSVFTPHQCDITINSVKHEHNLSDEINLEESKELVMCLTPGKQLQHILLVMAQIMQNV